jgi:hypothetical protein
VILVARPEHRQHQRPAERHGDLHSGHAQPDAAPGGILHRDGAVRDVEWLVGPVLHESPTLREEHWRQLAHAPSRRSAAAGTSDGCSSRNPATSFDGSRPRSLNMPAMCAFIACSISRKLRVRRCWVATKIATTSQSRRVSPSRRCSRTIRLNTGATSSSSTPKASSAHAPLSRSTSLNPLSAAARSGRSACRRREAVRSSRSRTRAAGTAARSGGS